MNPQEILDEEFPKEKVIPEKTELPDIFLQLLFVVGAIISISSSIQLYNGYISWNPSILGSRMDYLSPYMYMLGIFYGCMMLLTSVLGFVNGKKAINLIWTIAFSDFSYNVIGYGTAYFIDGGVGFDYFYITIIPLPFIAGFLYKFPRTVKENIIVKMICGGLVGLIVFISLPLIVRYFLF